LFALIESVPDAEMFYENPGAYAPHYHVLENPEEVPSYASCPSGSRTKDETPENFSHASAQEVDQNSAHDDVARPSVYESIYTSSPSSPVSTAGNIRDSAGNFPLEQPGDSNDYADDVHNNPSFDDDEEHDGEDCDIYANSEAISNSYLKENAIDNPGYAPDDEEKDISQHDVTGEPIYVNQIDIDDRVSDHNKSEPPTYALLKDQINEGTYQDLRGTGSKTSDYQSFSPVTTRKHSKPKIKPKPKSLRKP
jgi:hypothetical protein